MFSGNQAISYYTPRNVIIWMSMAFQAGMLNVGGFMACHRFVSHVTGFATFFGMDISQGAHTHAFGMLAVPLFFLFGAALSGSLVDIKLQTGEKPKYYIVFGFIFALILIVLVGGVSGEFGKFGEPLSVVSDYTLLALLCMACGIQNGVITTVSKSVIRTTHLTGITTDLGIGLVRVLHKEKLAGKFTEEFRANLMRIGIISFFGMGSVIGAAIFHRHGYGGFAAPALTSGVLFLATLLRVGNRRQ